MTHPTKNAKSMNVIVLGANSTIAEALCRQLAVQKASMVLVSRKPERLDQLCADLRSRGANTAIPFAADLSACGSQASASLTEMASALSGPIDAILVIYGLLGDQKLAEMDLPAAEEVLRTNFMSAAMWCLASAALLEKQATGVLIAISSVAGDRGRQSNYVYGAAKAGLSVLVEGIAHRLAPTGAKAVAVKLGFADTAMTAHIERKGLLWAKPDAVATRLAAIISRPGGPIVYMPWFWRPIMFVIRNVPAALFHRTKL
jgi:decaprenylphospho-beta-D-erythro-pentofuranosid-2-ulose 2-reductase